MKVDIRIIQSTGTVFDAQTTGTKENASTAVVVSECADFLLHFASSSAQLKVKPYLQTGLEKLSKLLSRATVLIMSAIRP